MSLIKYSSLKNFLALERTIAYLIFSFAKSAELIVRELPIEEIPDFTIVFEELKIFFVTPISLI